MRKKYIVPTLLIIFAFALLVGSIRMFINSLKDSATNLSIDSLEPFNEVIHAPDSYRILGFDKWTEDGSPAKVSQVENSHISVIEDRIESVQKITDILNEKTFIPILLILSPIISLTSSIKIESSSIIAIFIILIFLSPKVFSNQSNNPITCLHLKKINHFFQH